VVEGDQKVFSDAVLAEFQAVKAEYAVADPDMQMDVSEAAGAKKAWSRAATLQALRLLEALPHGVLAMSLDIPGLVETSTNVATAATQDDKLVIGTSSRSSVMSALRATQRRIRATGELAGAEIDEGSGYPGWKPDMSSKLLEVVRAVHEKVQGREAEIVAVHAGLECGIIGEKVPGMDMISFGPQIEHPHSPNERVQVASVGRFYQLLSAVLATLA
ncbi:MAG TPA: M20/M25/M40 family metallo-hydrolase, partial [Longimicrobiales bacterium]